MSSPTGLDAGSPPLEPAVRADAEWRRLSPRMLLIHPIREVGRFIPALLAILFAGSSSGQGHWWSLGALVIVVVLSVLRWFTTRYQITPEQIQLRTGLFRRRTMAAPADRVRTVDVTAHALHRALGLARVAIGTGTSDRKREGLVLDGLSARAAGQLRAELLHRSPVAPQQPSPVAPSGTADAAPAGYRPPPDAPEQVIARLDPAWVRYAPFTLSGALTGLALAGFVWRIINQTRVNLERIGVIHSAGDHLRHTAAWLDAVQLTVGILVFITVLSIGGYVLAFWNFVLSRHTGGTLHIARGLITSRAISIEERRLCGVEISEPLLLRAVGGARLLVVATGLRVGRGAERGGTLLLPPAPADVARHVTAAVLGTGQPLQATLIAHGPAARRRRLVRAVSGWLLLTAVLALAWWAGPVPLWAVLVAAGLTVLSVPLGHSRYRNLGHALTPDYLVTRFGSLARRHVLLQRSAVIGWNLRQSIFQRRAGLITLEATTAAGKQGYRCTDLTAETAVRLADAATPGLLRQFLA